MTASGTVMVTGAFGLVGRATVKRLVAEGRRVVATDLETPAYVKAARKLPAGVEVRWADLTDQAQIDELLGSVSPTAIIHLVGMIAPAIYKNPQLGRTVNVDIGRSLLAAAQAQPTPPRFVHASSVAVFGARNPHLYSDPARADSPTCPNDVYGATKLAAEELVQSSSLEWVILRLGAVVSTELTSMLSSWDVILFESALPLDGRIHTVDVRDVAKAFATATTADAAGKILLIGGDDSHLLRYSDAGHDLTAAVGLDGALPPGRPGDPNSDIDWFATDWMDAGPAQECLCFQHHSWPSILAEVRAQLGWKRHLLRPFAPVVRAILTRRSAYHSLPGKYADPWGIVRSRLGDPGPDNP
ncbi:NAD(P)-dependent oxidoreductase [Mycobacterium sp. E796]|uniref:NAD-dependent epimerase/dehydratase family protein n=1 Tax=Mycobacterium sp. E796 TaxID=1834151 RepID=UPI0007FFC4C6|nr:NAD(P)-dependent oxidoreductase [Mycobacterium sp. E796]OBI43992.1 oxidoreductase [Mycobacterium sp. E796]